MKEYYPFSRLCILPTVCPQLARITTIAACKDLIISINGVESDFLGEFSRELSVIIPTDYQINGCLVYGAKWFERKFFKDKDIHFYLHNNHFIEDPFGKYGYRMCVGVPESFFLMQNPILESVRTAENMLIAYERVMIGQSKELDLIAYAHGKEGEKAFHTSKSKYIPMKGERLRAK